jgi:glyoxylase-like metal-dependent hydrolase (beta-lactamase superfamily II)
VRPRELSATVESFAARTPTLPPATHTNSYALGSRDVVLVEPATPYEDELRAWVAWATALPSQGRKPLAIVATHHHPDHVGGLDVLAQSLNLPIWAHELTQERLRRSRFAHVRIARRLLDGEEIALDGPVPSRWRVLHTPGHAPGHVCLFDAAAGSVVVGDMVASEGTILVDTVDGDMQIYLEQLERLAKLGARLALPAHGEPIDDPTALFRKYVAHRRMREQKIVSAIAALGDADVDAIVPVAYADTPSHL